MPKHLGERMRAGTMPHTVTTVAVVAIVACALVFLAVKAPSGPDSTGSTVVGDAATSPEDPVSTATAPEPTTPPSPSTAPATPRTLPVQPVVKQLPAVVRTMGRRGFQLVPREAWGTYDLRISSFNILGASHTRGRKSRPGFRSGMGRLPAQIDLLRRGEITVAGMQEFQATQVRAFMRRTGGAWDVYPGTSLGDRVADNSIIWRTEEWEALERRTIDIPYFRGRAFPMPYVLLRHRVTGHRIWIGNFHNPANSRGPAAGLRAEAIRREARLAVELGRDGTPVFITGDMNDRAAFACPFTEQSGLVSADGAYHDGSCHLPRRMNVDWILGSRQVAFTQFLADFSTKKRRISDHPMITATAVLPGIADRPGCVARLADRATHWFCKP